MKRRDFIGTAGPAAVGVGMLPGKLFAENSNPEMTATDLNAYLRSLIEVAEPSVDKIIVGDPDTTVSKIGTAWMPYWDTLKEARDKGVNTMVVHEPTFYTHRDLEETQWDYLSASSPAKEIYLELVVVNHGTTEEFGMKELSVQLNKALPNFETLHFKQGCTYMWITA